MDSPYCIRFCVNVCGDSTVTTEIKAHTYLPCAVGFGISTPEQAQKMAACSDGVIIGSAIVRIIAQYGQEAVPPVAEYVRSIKKAIE